MGCGRSYPKPQLLRLVRGADGIDADPDARRPGRGAYVCADLACPERALRRRGFDRALRAAVPISDDTLDCIRSWQRSASTR